MRAKNIFTFTTNIDYDVYQKLQNKNNYVFDTEKLAQALQL